MTITQLLITLIAAVAFLLIGFVMGKQTVSIPSVEEPEKKKRLLLRKPTYDAGNLLDPISPSDQRLDRLLEMTAKEEARKYVQKELD